MSSKYPKAISSTVAIGAVAISCLCLYVSFRQAGGFLASLNPDIAQKSVLYIFAFAVIASSPIISLLLGIGRGKLPAWTIGLSLLCVMGIELFSISTSASAFTSHIESVQRTQNLQSPEYTMAINSVNNLQNAIAMKQDAAKSLPATWISRREDAARDIINMNRELMTAQALANQVNVSTTGKVFDGIENKTGLSPVTISLIGACLLSGAAFVLLLLVGHIVGQPNNKTIAPVAPQEVYEPKK